MFSTWQTPPGREQLQSTIISYGLALFCGVFRLEFASLMQWSTLKFKSFFPNCPAISPRASTAPSIFSKLVSLLEVLCPNSLFLFSFFLFLHFLYKLQSYWKLFLQPTKQMLWWNNTQFSIITYHIFNI
jgi:hypothetical protein